MKIYPILIIFSLLLFYTHSLDAFQDPLQVGDQLRTIWDADIIITSSIDPYYSLLASSIACFFPFQNNTSIIKPVLINNGEHLLEQHQRFINTYKDDPFIIEIGNTLKSTYVSQSFNDSPSEVSLYLASFYDHSSKAIIIPYGAGMNYSHSLRSTLLSSYLHIPLIIYDNNINKINTFIDQSNIETVIIIGDINPNLIDIEGKIILPDEQSLSNYILQTIKRQFPSLDYITITNPKDIQPIQVIASFSEQKNMPIHYLEFTLFGKSIPLQGTLPINLTISIPSGIHHLKCIVSYTPNIDQQGIISLIDPHLTCELKDPYDNIVAYSQSSSYEIGNIYVDTLINNLPGNYTISVSPYHGLKGGYFSSRGFSLVNGDLDYSITLDELENSHFPRIPALSSLAAYLTSSYGGYIIANDSYSLTSIEYDTHAYGYGTGPWYEEDLHQFNNHKVTITVNDIKKHLDLLESNGLKKSYLHGPAWLAILADTNMIPMYYYHPSQSGLQEKGLPSDNPYSLNESLSIGRIMSYSIEDVSNLICRTLFYKTICLNQNNSTWYNSFHFMYGEGFGETGGWFHQIPYAKQIESYGFETEVYGDFRNNRQFAEAFNIFTGANYNEYLGHADWFWFAPSLYGVDINMKSFDVIHVKNWVFNRPSLFLTSACLMGRVDGLPPWLNIGMSLLHAGCNAFVGATRETGQEAGLEILENSLIRNDTSIGEALRKEKTLDKGLPTYYVRILYGDPAFNPYEPNNGFTIERKIH
jgi:hypothetical protein